MKTVLLFAVIATATSFAGPPKQVEVIPAQPLIIPNAAGSGPAIVQTGGLRLTVRDDGSPFSIDTQHPLPDYAVQAIRSWRFKRFASSDTTATIQLTLHLRRPLTPDIENSMLVHWEYGS